MQDEKKKRNKRKLTVISILIISFLLIAFFIGKKIVFYLHDRAQTENLFEEAFPFSLEGYEVLSREDTVLWNAHEGKISVTLLVDEAGKQAILAEIVKLGFEDVTKRVEGVEYWKEYILILEKYLPSRRDLWSAVDVPKHLPRAIVRVKPEGEKFLIELIYSD